MSPKEDSTEEAETPEERDRDSSGEELEDGETIRDGDALKEESADSDAEATDGEVEEERQQDEDEETEVDPASISRIKTIRVNPDDVVQAIAYNGQEEIGRKGKTVFGLTPPFEEVVVPTIRHLADDSTKSKAEGEIHLRPFRFVSGGRRAVDQRPTRQLAKEELNADDPDEATIEAWIDEAMETWKEYVRENLIESVDIFSPHGMAIVSVEYESSEERS